MMHYAAIYLIKVILVSALLFGYYLLVLKDKKFHRYNRYYLLLAVVLSIVLPLVKFDLLLSAQTEAMPVFISGDMVGDAIVLGTPASSIWSWSTVSVSLYALGVLLTSSLFIWSVSRLIRLKKKGNSMSVGDIVLVLTAAQGTPFSFFKWIYWHEATGMDSIESKKMLQHELVHVREYHSYDKVFMNVVVAIFWFNPVFWLARRELSMVHEFIADHGSFKKEDVDTFSRIALNSIFPGHTWSAASGFFYSPLKRRLTMLLKHQHQKVSYLGRVMALPLAAALFIVFSMKASANSERMPPGSSTSAMATDTIPNAEVVSLKVITPGGIAKVVITDKSGKKETLSLQEAENRGLEIPPPPPPPISPYFPENYQSLTFQGKGKDATVIIVFKNGSRQTLTLEQARDRGVLPPPPPPDAPPPPPPPPPLSLSSLPDNALYILDGKEADKQTIVDLNPDQIKSVSILKGKNATEAFGLKGRNGVIKVNTTPAEPGEFDNFNSPSDTIPRIKDRIFTKVDIDAEFPGGQAAWTKYIRRVIEAHITELDENDYGTCIVKFLVDKNGNVSHIEALTLEDTKLSAIAVDAIRKGPKWIPAQQNGQYVNAFRLQPVTLKKPVAPSPVQTFSDDSKIFVKVEKEATFPGGKKAWLNYITKTMKEHLDQFTDKDFGTCVLRFVVDKDGKVSDVTATAMQGTTLAKVCIDAIRKGPDWIPAQQNGKYVNAYRLQPITLMNPGK